MGKYPLKTNFYVVLLVALFVLTGCGTSNTTPTAPAGTPVINTPAAMPTGAPPVVDPTPVVDSTLPVTGGDQPTPFPTEMAPATAAPTQAAPTDLQPLTDARSFPDPNGYVWEEVAAGLDRPIGLTTAEDGTNRLFVLEREGRIRLIGNGQLVSRPFMDITGRVGSDSSEQGLLGLDFSPDYEQNGFFFVNYTDRNGHTVISRFSVGADPNQGDPDSEVILLTQNQPYPNHNGGEVTFGPDGYLYLGLGDGGSAADPQDNAQNRGTLLGKILRIDVSQGDRYTIPADNPFLDGNARSEIWAYGLRNPWRFSFDRANGDLYIADVGQNQWEEVHYVAAGTPGGGNFGWPYFEGTHSFKNQPPAGAELVQPVFEYDHQFGCSITGGFVYRGQMAEWQGIYLFGDYCSGNIWGLLPGGSSTGQLLWKLPVSLSSFGQDEMGEVYLVNMNGTINRLARR